MESSTWLMVGFLVLWTATGADSSTASEYSSHEPISIDSDSEFTPQNGVTGGAGTSSNPFVIEGWKIIASVTQDQDCAIRIENVTTFFVIRNTHVDLSGQGAGVEIRNSTNGVLASSTISNCHLGISVSESGNLTIKENTLAESVETGFLFVNTDGIRFYHNDVLCTPGYIGWGNTNASLDDGYPSGGNYWKCVDSGLVDEFRGPLQDQPGRDGIADKSFSASKSWHALDSYPLMKPYGESSDESNLPVVALILGALAAASVAFVVIGKQRQNRKGV